MARAASTPESATSPVHYAILEGAFADRLGGVIALARRRERDGLLAIPREELPLLALATFALADVVANDPGRSVGQNASTNRTPAFLLRC